MRSVIMSMVFLLATTSYGWGWHDGYYGGGGYYICCPPPHAFDYQVGYIHSQNLAQQHQQEMAKMESDYRKAVAMIEAQTRRHEAEMRVQEAKLRPPPPAPPEAADATCIAAFKTAAADFRVGRRMPEEVASTCYNEAWETLAGFPVMPPP